MTFLKYFCVFMAGFSGASAGIAIANANYLMAALYILCVYLNINSYKFLSQQ